VRKATGSVWALTALVAGLCGCAGEGTLEAADGGTLAASPPTWEEFRDSARYLEGRGIYLANGDETFRSLEELRAYYDARTQPQGLGTQRAPLLVDLTDGGQRNVWSASQKRQITYCVSTSSPFHEDLVLGLKAAAHKWEMAADVDFIHLSQFDGNCGAAGENVEFRVGTFQNEDPCDVDPHGDVMEDPLAGGSCTTPARYVAEAFAPDWEKGKRELRVNTYFLAGTSDQYELAMGSLLHELGHILGFRHEHIRRPQTNGFCIESEPWEALTSDDPDSVMNYGGTCGGNRNRSQLSALDRQGVQAVYGPRPSGRLQGVGGKCLDVNWVTGWPNGTEVQLWDCTGAANQVWSLHADGSVRGPGGKCLEVAWAAGWPNGTQVQLWDCTGGVNQQWMLEPNGSLRGAGGKCLDVAWTAGWPNGTPVQLWDCAGTVTQAAINQSWQHVIP
jgi:hypothetical protein